MSFQPAPPTILNDIFAIHARQIIRKSLALVHPLVETPGPVVDQFFQQTVDKSAPATQRVGILGAGMSTSRSVYTI